MRLGSNVGAVRCARKMLLFGRRSAAGRVSAAEHFSTSFKGVKKEW